MMNQADIELALENAFSHYCSENGQDKVPHNLTDHIRFSLHSPDRRIGARLLLATAEMLELSSEAALPAAIALEFTRCSQVSRRDENKKNDSPELSSLTSVALLSLAFEVFVESSKHVKAPYFIGAQKRLAASIGAKGTAGGEAMELTLSSESSLDELRAMHIGKTVPGFSLALLLPKDFAGLADDSAEGLALEILARELGLAFQVLEDLERKPTDPTPSNIRFFLQDHDARAMTVQRLKSAILSVESLWGEKAKSLLMTAREILIKVESLSED